MPRSRKPTPLSSYEDLVLEDRDVVRRDDRHLACCGHPCAFLGTDHSQNHVCCLCERCLLLVLQRQHFWCSGQLQCGHTCGGASQLAFHGHKEGLHIDMGPFHSLCIRDHSQICDTCTKAATRHYCGIVLPCRHPCGLHTNARRPHRHDTACPRCLVTSLDWLLGRDYHGRSLLPDLPRDVLGVVMSFVGQPLCTGCKTLCFGNHLRAVTSPDDLDSGWHGPFCTVPEPQPFTLLWAPDLVGLCTLRWIPQWMRLWLAREEMNGSRLKDVGKAVILVMQLCHRLETSSA